MGVQHEHFHRVSHQVWDLLIMQGLNVTRYEDSYPRGPRRGPLLKLVSEEKTENAKDLE
jgi:hypothetical protein